MEQSDQMTDALKARGPEFVIANDIPRVWATGAQVFINNEHALMIFREQNILNDPEQDRLDVVMRNVASLVLPVDIAVQFYTILGEQLKANGHIEAE